MSLNQILNPSKPLDIVVNSVNGSSPTSTVLLKDDAGSYEKGLNMFSIAGSTEKTIIEKLTKVQDIVGNEKQVIRISSATIQILSDSPIDPVNQNKMRFTIHAQSIRAFMVSCSEQCTFTGRDVSGSYELNGHLKLVNSVDGSAVFEIECPFGQLNPSTNYYLAFSVMLY